MTDIWLGSKSIVVSKSLVLNPQEASPSFLELLADATGPLVNISTVSLDSRAIRLTFTVSNERDFAALISHLESLIRPPFTSP